MNIDNKKYGRFDPMQRSRDFIFGPHPRAEARRLAAAAFGTTDLANQTQGSSENDQGALPTFEQQPQPEGSRVGQLYVKRNVGALDTVNASITDELGNPIMVVLNTLSTDKPTPAASGFITQRGPNLPLSDAYGVATDNGHVWVSSPLLRTVFKFNGDAGTLDPTTPCLLPEISLSYDSQIGTGVAGAGTSPVQFNQPQQMAIGVNGWVIVADTANNRLIWIDPATGLWSGGSLGFTGVTGVCTDAAGNIYAVGGTTLRKYNSSGVQQGADVFTIYSCARCATDGTNVFVTSAASNLVMKFSTASPPAIISYIAAAGAGDGQFNNPYGIAVDSLYIYVADVGNQRIQAFTKATNVYHRKWATQIPGMAIGSPFDLSISPITGNVFSSSNSYAGVVEWSKFGEFRRLNMNGVGSGVGQYFNPQGVLINLAGTKMYVSDQSNNRILQWTIPTSDFIPYGIHVDKPTGFVYVADQGTRRVCRFSWNGRENGSYGFSSGLKPSDVAVTGSGGKVWVTYNDAGLSTHQLRRYHEATGALELTIGGAASSVPGQFDTPLALTLDVQGNVWVADYGNDRVQQFDPSGVLLHAYGVSGSDPGKLNGPSGLEFDASGNIWVVDHDISRIQIFDQNFGFLNTYGTAGLGTGQFNTPWHVAISGDGVIFVADGALNARVARLRLPETSLVFLIDDEEINDVLAWRGTAWVNRGGGEFLIGTAEFSSSAGLTADGIFGAEFDEYRISGYAVLSVFGSALYIRLRVGGVELAGVGYTCWLYTWTNVATAGAAAQHASSVFNVIWPIAGGQPFIGFEAVIKNPYRPLAKTWDCFTSGVYNGVDWRAGHIGGFHGDTGIYDGLRIFPSSGLITSGWCDIFGRTT